MQLTALQNTYVTWEALTAELNALTGRRYSSDNVHTLHKGLSLDGKLPYSISEYEFNYMRNFLIKHKLKNGFELATGIAISTLALGSATQQLGGTLISLDSYEEELTQEQPVGKSSSKHNVQISLGLTTNHSVLEAYQLKNTQLIKGWSPTDAISSIQKLFGEKSLDYVFLDCPKCASDFRRDATYLPRFLNSRFAIFVHDTHCYTNEFVRMSQDIFSITPIFLTDFAFGDQHYKQHFPLALITNIAL